MKGLRLAHERHRKPEESGALADVRGVKPAQDVVEVGLGDTVSEPRRQQLRGVLPQQRRPLLPRLAARYRLGLRGVGSAYLHPAPPSPGRGGCQ